MYVRQQTAWHNFIYLFIYITNTCINNEISISNQSWFGKIDTVKKKMTWHVYLQHGSIQGMVAKSSFHGRDGASLIEITSNVLFVASGSTRAAIHPSATLDLRIEPGRFLGGRP